MFDLRETDRGAVMAPPVPVRKKCQHCKKRVASRPWKLCRVCYSKGAVRQLYKDAKNVRYAARGIVVDHYGPAPPPAEPTQTPVGSLERLKVLRKRAGAGEEMSHPLDSRAVVPGLCRPFEGRRAFQLGDEDLLAGEPAARSGGPRGP